MMGKNDQAFFKQPGKRGLAPKIQQQLELITQLSRARQKIVMEMLDGVLSQANR